MSFYQICLKKISHPLVITDTVDIHLTNDDILIIIIIIIIIRILIRIIIINVIRVLLDFGSGSD